MAEYISEHTGAEIDAGIRPYKVYTALLNQSGTNAPTATVLENTLGGTVVWTRVGQGSYIGTLANAFTANKTVIMPINQDLNSSLGYGIFQGNWSSTSIVSLTTRYQDGGDWGFLDDMLYNTPVEIRIYP